MSTRDAYLRTLLAGCVVLQSLAPSVAPADPIFGRLGRLVHEATYHGVEPATCEVGAIEELAENIDWLERHIDKYGSVVAKQPDIWGEARLTKHRDEYERMMFGELNQFQYTINASISQGDSAFLAQAIALSNAASGAATKPENPTSTAVAVGTATAALQNVDDPAKTTFHRFGIADTPKPEDPGIKLEPTIFLDQMSRYLQHLHELRRINEGDDTSDSPGYSLNLVRIPVSILPGKLTRQGFGAEVTVTCTPVLSDDLMPTTFRNLVINDVVHQLRLPVTRQSEAFVRDDFDPKPVPCNSKGTLSIQTDLSAANFDIIAQASYTKSMMNSPVGAAQSQISLARAGKAFGDEVIRRIACDFLQTYDGRYLRWNGWTACKGDSTKTPEKRVDLLDVHGWLDAETAAAYELLKQPEHIWLFAALASPSSKLASQIRGGHYSDPDKVDHGGPTVEDYRAFFFQWLHATPQEEHLSLLVNAAQQGCDVFSDSQLLDEVRGTYEGEGDKDAIPQSSIEALAWALVVESALLNEHLNNDVRKLAKSKEVYSLDTGRDHWFFLPDSVLLPGDGLAPLQGEFQAATDVFQEYVKARWPIHVFAVDPREQDQNVADVSNRKREMQFALALGFATGKIGVNSLTQYSRELDTQIETISLNRTIVGFGHGADTFGWRFYPRVQALPVPGTLGVLRETLMGTSRDYDLKHRQIEPGARECVAIVLMPSFIPYADFDIRTNWFKLTNPKNAALTMKDSVRLSRAITAMHNSKAQCSRCAHLYREGEIDRLMKRVQQLDHELPLQTQRALVPYENTLGGFEMFNTGVTDLAPQLIGWYGAPGIDLDPTACGCYEGCTLGSGACDTPAECTALNGRVNALSDKLDLLTTANARLDRANPLPTCQGVGTTLFLVGENFSVHDTKVIAGGVCIPHVRLVSREIMQVTIPHCVNTVELCENGVKNPYVAVYVATPYGVTSHLHVPVTAQAPRAEAVAAQKLIEAEVTKQVGAAFNARNIPPREISVAPVGSPKKLVVSAVSTVPATVQLHLEDGDIPIIRGALHNATDPRFTGKRITVHGVFFANERFQGNLVPLTRTPINPTDDLGAIGTDGVRGAGWIGLKEQLAKVATYEILKASNGKVTGTIVYYLQIDGETTTTRVLEEMPVEINLREERPATAGLPSGASMSTPSADEEAEEVTAEPVSSDNPDDCNCGPRMTDWSPWTQHEVAPSPFRLAQFSTPGADQGDALKDVTLAVRENARVLAELSERVNALSNTRANA